MRGSGLGFALRPAMAFALCAVLLGCGGKSPPSLSDDPALARRAGGFAAAITQAELGRVALPELDAYLASLVARLAPSAPGGEVEWRVAVLDDPGSLAVGFEGGHLLLSRGLLVEVPDEPELLRSLATEMAHVGLGHATPRLEALSERRAPASPGEAADLVLPGLGRPLSSVGNLRASLEAVPYGPEARAAAVPVVEAMLAAATAAAADSPEAFPALLAGLAVGPDPRGGIIEGGRRLVHADLDLAITFPEGWPVRNAADFVQAVAPDAEARIVFQLVAEGEDPVVPARTFAQGGGARFGLLPRPREIGGRRAARARGSSGDAALDVTWLVKDGQIYQLSGVCPPKEYDRLQVDFIDVALSLGSPGALEATRFEPVILHVEVAREGESVEALVARSGGTSWELSRVAELAGVTTDEPLRAGVRVRVPRRAPLPASETPDGRAPEAQP
jgi:predicted Zn-dependent protease